MIHTNLFIPRSINLVLWDKINETCKIALNNIKVKLDQNNFQGISYCRHSSSDNVTISGTKAVVCILFMARKYLERIMRLLKMNRPGT